MAKNWIKKGSAKADPKKAAEGAKDAPGDKPGKKRLSDNYTHPGSRKNG